MGYDPKIHHRRSIRLKGYDYRRVGAYFVTICTQNRECLFGEIVGDEMRLSQAGLMVEVVWEELPGAYPGVDVDAFVVMPNHVHGIIVLTRGTLAEMGRDPSVGAGPRACPTAWQAGGHGTAPTAPRPAGVMSLPEVVQRFKSLTTARYRQGVAQYGWPPFPGRVWQRDYYEHVIRNDEDMDRVREYIVNNPARWAEDEENPARLPKV